MKETISEALILDRRRDGRVTWAPTEPLARARNSDPATSHEAADKIERKGKADTHRALCLMAVRSIPGMTCYEIDEFLGLREVGHRRLPELREEGWVVNGEARKCRISGNNCMTWYLAPTRQLELF